MSRLSAYEYERVYVCVDDTDDLTKATSTGSIADAIADAVQKEFGSRINMGVTRHQLFLDDSVPYTSHNSAMCFDMLLPKGCAKRIEEIGWVIIHAMQAESANPGLCILPAPWNESAGEDPMAGIRDRYAALILYGREAKTRYISRDEAVQTAQQFPEILLKWDGETGQGRIGALAGIGLRMSGGDGRFRGKYDLRKYSDKTEDTVARLKVSMADKCPAAPAFVDEDGADLEPEDRVVLTGKVKPVLLGARMTIMCYPAAVDTEETSRPLWMPHVKDTLPKENHLKKARKKNRDERKKRKMPEMCPRYVTDPDEEEHFNENQVHTCGTCLYRRLTSDGYICSLPAEYIERIVKRSCT